MEKLKIIENGLVPIMENEKGKKLVDGRILHEFLEVGRDFTSWIKGRIKKYGFNENTDYILTLTKTGERQNVIQHEYILTIDMAKELSMVENNDKGREARKYFIECENKLKEMIQLQVDSYMIEDPVKRAERWIEEMKEKELLQDKVIELEPKAKYLDDVVKSPNGITATQIAKELGLPSAAALNQLLADCGVQYKHRNEWILYSKYADKEYTVPNCGISSKTGYVFHSMNWTEKGKQFIYEILKDKQ